MLFKTGTVISAVLAQARTCKTMQPAAVSSAKTAQGWWWVYRMKWALDVDHKIAETRCKDRIHWIKCKALFEDQNTEMRWAEEGNSSSHNTKLIQYSRRIRVVQVRCINSTTPTMLSIKLPKVHTEMESEITQRPHQSATREATKTWSISRQWNKASANTATKKPQTAEAAPSKTSTNAFANIKGVRERQVSPKLYSNRMWTTVLPNCKARQHQPSVRI